MKEHEVKGLVELKTGFERQLSECKEYQELKERFDKSAAALVRDAVATKGFKLVEEEGKLPFLVDRDGISTFSPALDLAVASSCGFCESCITDCVSCVTGSAS